MNTPIFLSFFTTTKLEELFHHSRSHCVYKRCLLTVIVKIYIFCIEAVWGWGAARQDGDPMKHHLLSALNTNRVASRYRQKTQVFLRKRTAWILTSHSFWQSWREAAVENADFACQLHRVCSQMGRKWSKSLKKRKRKKKRYAPKRTHIQIVHLYLFAHLGVPISARFPYAVFKFEK